MPFNDSSQDANPARVRLYYLIRIIWLSSLSRTIERSNDWDEKKRWFFQSDENLYLNELLFKI